MPIPGTVYSPATIRHGSIVGDEVMRLKTDLGHQKAPDAQNLLQKNRFVHFVGFGFDLFYRSKQRK